MAKGRGKEEGVSNKGKHDPVEWSVHMLTFSTENKWHGRNYSSFLGLQQQVTTNLPEIYSLPVLGTRTPKSRFWQGHTPSYIWTGDFFLIPSSF
jgi:hypothetical protein